MAQVACFGELLLRLAATDHGLLLQYPRLDVHVGGAEANVAVGLTCLGHSARMISRVPANQLGNAATAELRRRGVDVTGVSTGEGRMGLYFLAPGAGARASSIVYDREGSSFATAPRSAYDFEHLLGGAELLHLSGITPALGNEPAAAALAAAEAATADGIPVSFDCNYRGQLWERQAREPAEVLRPLVAQARILFGNSRDIALLLRREFKAARDAAEAAFEAFPALRLIGSTSRTAESATNHRMAARIDTPEAETETEEMEVDGIVDRIGAGDAFAAGLLHGVLSGYDLEATARYGLALGVLKHSLPGDASLFTRSDVEAFLSGQRDVRR